MQDPQLIISHQFTSKVNLICSKIPDVEWGGDVLFTVKDNQIIPKEVIPIQKGTKGRVLIDTEEIVQTNIEDIVHKYFEDEIEKFHIGKIHSHNSMGVGMSKTDVDDIKEMVKQKVYNPYLSIVCNNNLSFSAKVGYLTHVHVNYKDFKGNDVYEQVEDVKIKDLKITRQFRENNKYTQYMKEFMSEIDRIEKEERKKKNKEAARERQSKLFDDHANPHVIYPDIY